MPGLSIRDRLTRDVLYAMGFFDDVQAAIEEENGRRVLVFRVVERPLIREVKLEGRNEISEEDLEGAPKVRPYTILVPIHRVPKVCPNQFGGLKAGPEKSGPETRKPAPSAGFR